MVPACPQEGQDTSPWFITSIRYLTNIQDKVYGTLKRRLAYFGVSAALGAMPMINMAPPVHSHHAVPNVIDAHLVLSHGTSVISTPASSIDFKPGDSNTTIAVKKHQFVNNYQAADAINAFLQKKRSPMQDHASELVAAAEQYHIDAKLLVGISGAESSFGAHLSGAHNPFGLGPTRSFSSFAEAFAAEAQFLHQHFTSRGVTNPLAIGPSYTGTGSTTWGPSVLAIMHQI